MTQHPTAALQRSSALPVMRPNTWILALALALAALPLTCDRPGDLPEHPRLVHLELQRIAGQEDSREPLVVLSLQVPEGSRHWGESVEAPARLPGQDGTEVRVWKGGGQLFVPDPPDLSDAEVVEVVGRFAGLDRLRLRLVRGDEKLEVEHSVGAGEGPLEDVALETLRLELPPEAGAGRAPWSEVDLTVWGPDCELRELRFLALPLEDRLPAPEDPKLVGIGDSCRRSVGITRRRGLEATFEPGPGDELVFELGVPEGVRVRSGTVGLTVTLEADGRSEERSYRLQAPGTGWTEERIGLGDYVGQVVRARFELQAAEGQRAAAVLANPWVGHRGRTAPTVLLITSDTHRSDHLGASDAGLVIRTPALDALARRGVLFEDCYSTSNITAPSHAALLTGLTPRDTGLVSNEMRLSRSAYTLGEAFLEAGFATVGVVSNPFLGPYASDASQGFMRFDFSPHPPWRARVAVNRLLGMLDELEGQPLFVWLHVFDAHFPYEPPGEFDRLYYSEKLDPFDDMLPELDPDPGRIHERLQGLRDLDFPRAQYRGEISYLDAQLRRVLEHPRMADAIIAFTADHGEVLHNTRTLFDHVAVLPATLHVPLVLAWPGAPAGTRVAAPTLQPDVGRTLLDLAGLGEVPFPGRDLLDALDATRWRDAPRFALGDFGAHASVTAGRWFLMLHLRDDRSRGISLERHRVMLFDRDADPACLNDLAPEHPEIARDLRALLVTWLNEAPASLSAEDADLSEEQLAQLRALGYVGSGEAEASTTWIDPDCDCERCAEFR